MSELISGKEALIALANGEDVQASVNGFDWKDAIEFGLVYFLNGDAHFRLKPRTVNLNGVEVPSVKYVAHSGGNCVKISCECPEDAAAIGAALRSVFAKK